MVLTDTEATKTVADFDIENHEFQVPQKDATLAGPDGIPAWEKSEVCKLNSKDPMYSNRQVFTNNFDPDRAIWASNAL